MRDFVVAWIRGKRRALTSQDLALHKKEEMADHQQRLDKRQWYEEKLYEQIEGDTRTYGDMRDEWEEDVEPIDVEDM